MQSCEDVVRTCLTYADAYEDHPFDDVGQWTAMRHRSNKKIFALIFEREGHTWVNVKNDPGWGDFWRQSYASIVPGYHLNKLHWSSIILDGSVPEEVIRQMLTDSYDLTAPKRKKKYQDEF